jgi:hypothetical protein
MCDESDRGADSKEKHAKAEPELWRLLVYPIAPIVW